MAREVCDHLWPTESETPCPECAKEYKKFQRHKVWALITPDGKIEIDPRFTSATSVYRIALSIDEMKEIRQAKREGWIAKKVLVIV